MNRIKTYILLAGLTLLMVTIGRLLGGQQGMIIAFLLAVGINFFSYWFSDQIVLKAYKARPLTPGEAPELYGMVQSLAAAADLPTPKVCIIASDTPNAFATGRNPEHAVVAVTSGIVRLLSAHELRGVLAHELSHVKNRDILIGSIAACLAGAIMILASFARWGTIFGGDNRRGNGLIVLLLSIVAPLAAMIIQMAVSRSREYLADASAAQISRDPEALASALAKLEQGNQSRPMEASPQTAHMFIVNPLHGGGLARLFSTHPPIGERIARLRELAGFPEGARGGRGIRARELYDKPAPLEPSPPASPTRPHGDKIDWS
jgi:heat shock protein HtpX